MSCSGCLPAESFKESAQACFLPPICLVLPWVEPLGDVAPGCDIASTLLLGQLSTQRALPHTSSPAIQSLVHPDVPVELEPVDDLHLLGFHINPHNRTIQPASTWKIQAPASAYHAWHLDYIHVIKAYTFPREAAKTSIERLFSLCAPENNARGEKCFFPVCPELTATCVCHTLSLRARIQFSRGARR